MLISGGAGSARAESVSQQRFGSTRPSIPGSFFTRNHLSYILPECGRVLTVRFHRPFRRFSVFADQPAVPSKSARDLLPVETVVVQSTPVAPSAPAGVFAPLALPEPLPPEALSEASTPAAEEPISSSAASGENPEPDRPRQPTPGETDRDPESSPAAETPPADRRTERRQVIEQRLAELVERDKPQKVVRLIENLHRLAIAHAHAGKFVEARKLATDEVLPTEIRDRLLQEIETIRVARLKQVPQTAGKPEGRAIARLPASPILPGTVLPPLSIYPQIPSGDLGVLAPPDPRLPHRNLPLRFPLAIAAPITSLFGWRLHPIYQEPRFHQGLDLGAAVGTPVVAAHTGQVELADSLAGYGLTVILRHSKQPQATLYGHLSEIFVKPGESVKQGMVIGLVGNTGNSTGPHLHFELQEWTAQGWQAMDPLRALNQSLAIARTHSQPMIGIAPLSPFHPFQRGGTHPLSIFPGWFNRPLTDNMGLLLPLALSPLDPELGWLIYPLVTHRPTEPVKKQTASIGLPIQRFSRQRSTV